jgi:hypothetical protein
VSIRTYVIVLAGIISNLTVVKVVIDPIIERPYYPWRPVPEAGAVPLGSGGEWVLLPSNSGDYCLPRGFLGAYEIWRPDSAQLAQLERDLRGILPVIEAGPWGPFEPYREHAPPLHTYRRQYVGVRTLGEPPIIFVNAYLPYEDDDRDRTGRWNWRRRLACVDDGAWGYWHLEYDPGQRRFRGFAFNGSA